MEVTARQNGGARAYAGLPHTTSLPSALLSGRDLDHCRAAMLLLIAIHAFVLSAHLIAHTCGSGIWVEGREVLQGVNVNHLMGRREGIRSRTRATEDDDELCSSGRVSITISTPFHS